MYKLFSRFTFPMVLLSLLVACAQSPVLAMDDEQNRGPRMAAETRAAILSMKTRFEDKHYAEATQRTATDYCTRIISLNEPLVKDALKKATRVDAPETETIVAVKKYIIDETIQWASENIYSGAMWEISRILSGEKYAIEMRHDTLCCIAALTFFVVTDDGGPTEQFGIHFKKLQTIFDNAIAAEIEPESAVTAEEAVAAPEAEVNDLADTFDALAVNTEPTASADAAAAPSDKKK